MDIKPGDKFGKWTVINEAGRTKDRRILWHCQCECGKERNVVHRYLLSGQSTSCGCSRADDVAKPGERFGKLTVVCIQRKEGRMGRLCKCDCGNDFWARTDTLLEGKSTHCGCVKHIYPHIPEAKMINEEERGHILGKISMSYCDMVRRCYNPRRGAYHNYGGRNITVCDLWLKDRNSFLSWALLNGFKVGLQLDRRDNNGNYSPENCRWVTPKENTRNSRNAKLNEDMVADLRKRHSEGIPQKTLCEMFGMSASSVSLIVNNLRWT